MSVLNNRGNCETVSVLQRIQAKGGGGWGKRGYSLIKSYVICDAKGYGVLAVLV